MVHVRNTIIKTAAAGTAAVLATAVLPGLAPGPASAAADGLSARVSTDCTNGRLQLVLNNTSQQAAEFSIAWPGSTEGSGTWTRTLDAGENTLMHWTREEGTPYTLEITSPGGYDKTYSGTVGCGLDSGKPQMNTTELLGTETVIQGINGKDGTYAGTSDSVRIPAMAVTNSGTVITVADARIDGAGDLPGNIQLAMRRSTDDGATWSEPKIIQHAPTVSEGTGDSSLLVDRETGKVFLFYNYSPPGIGFNSPASGSNSADDQESLHVRYITSEDDGQSWSDPVDLNPDVKDASWESLFVSSGHGIQESGGRLLQPLVYRDSDGTTHAANISSDDNGETWSTGEPAGDGVNESKAVERGNGDVVQNMRSNTERKRFYATSPDGVGQFGPQEASGLSDPLVNADEISHLTPAEGTPKTTDTSLFSNPAHANQRNDLTVRLSSDDGATRPDSALLAPGTAGYSTMAVLDDGSVANLYEIGATGGIVFTRFTLDWIKSD